MIFQSSCKHCIAASFAFKQKRSLQLSVQPTLKFLVPTIGVARILIGGAQTTNHAMTSSETSKEEFFVWQRYHRMEDQKPWPGVGT